MSRADAFDALYRETRSRLVHQLYVVTGSVGEAHRAVSEGFVAAAHHWRKVERAADPEAWIRESAVRAAQRRSPAERTAGPPAAGDHQRLLDALQQRRLDDRHLVAAHLVAGLELTAAAREVGVTDDTALHSLAQTRRALEAAGIDLSSRGMTGRLDDLRTDLGDLPGEPPRRLRREGNRRRRQHLLVAGTAAVAMVIGAGALTAAKPEASAVIEAVPGSTSPSPPTPAPPAPETFEQPDFTAAQLGAVDDVARLDRDARWKVAKTSADYGATKPVHACLTMIPADPRASHVWVRTFTTASRKDQTVVLQALEVSRSDERARAGYERLVTQLATCPRGGYQVTEYARLKGAGDEATSVRLAHAERRGVSQDRIVVARSGRATVAWVVRPPSGTWVREGRLHRLLRDSINDICGYADGSCGADDLTVREVLPAVSPQSAGFLTAVDMPVLAGLPDPWVATRPERTRHNPAATQCDGADFRSAGAARLRTRDFVFPTAERLPDIFGMTQTVGEFGSSADARGFVNDVRRSVASCTDRQPSLEVESADQVDVRRGSGDVWEISVGTSENRALTFRVALIRVGGSVTQLTFTPTGRFDLSPGGYVELAQRATERLRQA